MTSPTQTSFEGIATGAKCEHHASGVPNRKQKPHGFVTYEAFNTSGGLGTLCVECGARNSSFGARVRSVQRYPFDLIHRRGVAGTEPIR